MQIGHERPLWPLAVVKELIDNALDACESAGVSPEVEVVLAADFVSVRDNGPGIPPATLERSLDYLVRVSDKQYYISPTRGQLGNALKCVWAAPYVATGEQAHVEVIAGGVRHDVTVRLSRIAQRPELSYDVSPDGFVRNGTFVKVDWPGIAGYLSSGIPQLLRAYGVFNPHASFTYRDACRDWIGTVEPTTPGWRKWAPSDPTSPHWYNLAQLRALVGAYVSDERNGGRARTVREFVSEFKGLAGTAKQKQVTDGAGLSGAYLHDLVTDDDVDPDRAAALLAAMQAESRAPKPGALGVLGEAHLTKYMVDRNWVASDSVKYKKVEGAARGLPFILEVAFGVSPEDDAMREVVVGLNWTPALKPPIRELMTLLGQQRIDPHDPVVVIVHLACPVMQFADRGKGVLDLLRED